MLKVVVTRQLRHGNESKCILDHLTVQLLETLDEIPNDNSKSAVRGYQEKQLPHLFFNKKSYIKPIDQEKLEKNFEKSQVR